MFTGFLFRSSYESCDAVFPAVVWGSSIAGCVVWVRVICWLVWGIVFRVRHKSGFSKIIIFLRLQVFKYLVCSPVIPCLVLGDVRGWVVLVGSL